MSEATEIGTAAAAETATSDQGDLPIGQDVDQAEGWMARIRAKYGDDGAGNPSVEPGDTTPDNANEPAPAKETPAAAAPEPPKEDPAAEPAKVEPEAPKEPEKPKQSREALQLGRALADNQRLQTELLELKKSGGTAKAELEALQASFKKNAFKALEKVTGKTLPELIEMGKRGEFDKAEPELPPDVAETVRWAKEAREREAQRVAAEKRQRDMEADRPKIKRLVEVMADKMPTIAALGEHGVNTLLEEYYDRLDKLPKGATAPDLRELAREMERGADEHFGGVFSNASLIAHAASSERFIGALKTAAADPKVRKKITEALGLAEQQTPAPTSSSPGAKTQPTKTQPAQPPASVAGQTEVPERASRELTPEEQRAESIRLLQQARERGLFASD